MTTCDALIVGGGPAGSACAWRLRQLGLDPLVLDRKTFPRDKTCAGWITPAVIDELEIDLGDYRKGRVLEQLTGFGTAMIGGDEVVTCYDRPISYGIRRCEFDHYLLERSGARQRLGEPLKSLERDNNSWIVNDSIKTPLVIGAGGHFCPVARHLGARREGGEQAVAAQEIEFEMSERQLRDCPVPPGIPFLYFCDDLQGYGWYYRKGNYLNVGLGREDDRNLSGHVSAFCSFLQERGKIPGDLPRRFLGHAYLIYPHARRELLDDGILLIGDAAGLAYGQSGEGIRPAVESGLIAAEVIRAASGDYRRAKLEPFAARLEARFGVKPKNGADQRPAPAWKRFLARKLVTWPWFARHIVIDRWFLHRNEAPLPSEGPDCLPLSASGTASAAAVTSGPVR
jgi:flavin-dependent dehydrogenase